MLLIFEMSVHVGNQEIYRQALWMKLYGHECLKRTLLWSTSRAVALLNLGAISKLKHKSNVRTARKYRDKKGVARYHGLPTLKGTQFLRYVSVFDLGVDGKFWTKNFGILV